ncbi:hypothetical protein AX15_003603 [Amanita polypyramis BW_CC]|nr:hypothetical protein AX15_003603 [Amanita polypyramis BW_CC]
MLPKVATHILHTTSRAAAAVHNQTSTFRNVLQLQTSSGPSTATGTANIGPWNGNGSGSSSWGNSHGAGTGSAKQNAGSRFYSGFTGPVRTVTQANAVTSQDGSLVQHDENQEEVASTGRRVGLPASKRTRMRSSSLSMGRVENLSVLKTVQIHARSRHAFAQAPSTSDAVKPTVAPQKSVRPSRPLITRRNSTSSQTSEAGSAPIRHNTTYTVANESSSIDPATLPPLAPTSATGLSPTDPSAPQTIQPSQQQSPGENADDGFPRFAPAEDTPAYLVLKAARDTRNSARVADAVHHFRQTTTSPTVREFNMALDALLATRRPGEPLTLIMETYGDMIQFSLIPTIQTYNFLIQALTDRDHEVQRLIRVTELRVRRRTKATGRFEPSTQALDEQKLEILRKEDNLSSALALFETIISINGNERLPFTIYHSLLRGTAARGLASQAARVFAQFERRTNAKVTPLAYKYMVQAYASTGELKSAEQVFEEFREICRKNPEKLDWGHERATYNQRRVLMVWNQMIDAYFKAGLPERAVGLLELMMGASSPKGAEIDVPSPSSLTFTAVLAGFCHAEDIQTALVWFNQLLEQQQAPGSNPLAQVSTEEAIRPDKIAWNVMIETLAMHGMVDELNTVFERMLTDGAGDDIVPTVIQRVTIFSANVKRLSSLDAEKAEQTLTFLIDKVMLVNEDPVKRSAMVKVAWKECLSRGLYELGTRAMLGYVESLLDLVSQGVIKSAATEMDNTREHLTAFRGMLYEKSQGAVPFDLLLKITRVVRRTGAKLVADEHIPYFLHSYGIARRAGSIPSDMHPKEWLALLMAALHLEDAELERCRDSFPVIADNAFNGIVSLLEDMQATGIRLIRFKREIVDRVLKVLFLRYDYEDLKDIMVQLGPDLQSMERDSRIAESQSPQSTPTLTPGAQSTNVSSPTLSPGSEADSTMSPPASPDTAKLQVDMYLSREIELILNRPRSPREAGERAYRRMMSALHEDRLPDAITLGRIIQCLGRAGDVAKVEEVYQVAQDAMDVMDGLKQWPTNAWFIIEDSMIIALAHAGEVDAAHRHRKRILENGFAPTADAYGVLILCMKDTTDDTSNAMALYQEAEMRGVSPNQYLYNNIISKLSKARKADYALTLFQRMKEQRIYPSSITYGAVIGACARVGDVQSAEALFSEMEAAKNFKPRVPPYNTMMQLYTTTKPNRERTLFYYEKMKEVGVTPTAHTYKLLMDAYGALEPVDVKAMEDVFSVLQKDTSVTIQGNHFASLINAYGCVCKDLAKAISIFDSIPSYYPRAQPADAVVYEAVINALVAHKRADLIPEYVSKMNEQGVKMTAYIANFLIKGYAIGGDLEQARAIFEGLADPPVGVAAPGNHVPHDGTTGAEERNAVMQPVYREPSTWEAMIRAELGAGHRTQALELLERLKSRKYPEAVYNRISGIMVDHSMPF